MAGNSLVSHSYSINATPIYGNALPKLENLPSLAMALPLVGVATGDLLIADDLALAFLNDFPRLIPPVAR